MTKFSKNYFKKNKIRPLLKPKKKTFIASKDIMSSLTVCIFHTRYISKQNQISTNGDYWFK